MTTKERISYEALNLFSQKGYKGTSVKNIADAVGIKDSSLYKHYKNKQEILDTIMCKIEQHIENMSRNYGMPIGDDYEKATMFYASLDKAGVIEITKKIFLFYLRDELISKFWKMGNIEQFQNDRVYDLFRRIFLEESIEYQTRLFKAMSEQDIFIKSDAEIMAISFYSPIFFLLSKYATLDGKEEEALTILEKQVGAFYDIYKK